MQKFLDLSSYTMDIANGAMASTMIAMAKTSWFKECLIRFCKKPDSDTIRVTNFEDVDRFIEAVSTQDRISNRVWLVVIALCFIVDFSNINECTGEIAFPFNFGSAKPELFYPIMLSMLGVVFLAFASAWAGQLQTRILFYDSLERNSPSLANDQQRKLRVHFDTAQHPALFRVGTLPTLGLNNKPMQSRSAFPRYVTLVYYWMLKLATTAIYIGIPLAAYIWGITKHSFDVTYLRMVVWGITTVGIMAWIQVFILDLKWTVRVFLYLLGWLPQKRTNST